MEIKEKPARSLQRKEKKWSENGFFDYQAKRKENYSKKKNLWLPRDYQTEISYFIIGFDVIASLIKI